MSRLPRRPAVPLEEFIQGVRENHSSLRSFIRLLGVEADWVDDVAQECFLVAYRSIEEFDRSRSFSKWMRGIARNIVANERRKSTRRFRILNAHLTDLLLTEGAQDLGGAEVAEIATALNDCLDSLPEWNRKLLRSRYANDENATLISRRLQMTPEAVRQVLMKSRLLLQSCIQGKLGEMTL